MREKWQFHAPLPIRDSATAELRHQVEISQRDEPMRLNKMSML